MDDKISVATFPAHLLYNREEAEAVFWRVQMLAAKVRPVIRAVLRMMGTSEKHRRPLHSTSCSFFFTRFTRQKDGQKSTIFLQNALGAACKVANPQADVLYTSILPIAGTGLG
ncbi:hypothetical protein [Deinococcus sp.]|uniref:hypothetical protein n=1 Tax=Deinococcus sp. TaxID=47478 RepID=UPI0025BB8A3F|nr:hypothetical protein [Deinococcus sp.]